MQSYKPQIQSARDQNHSVIYSDLEDNMSVHSAILSK